MAAHAYQVILIRVNLIVSQLFWKKKHLLDQEPQAK